MQQAGGFTHFLFTFDEVHCRKIIIKENCKAQHAQAEASKKPTGSS